MAPLTPYPLLPIASFLAFFLSALPLPIQCKSWNSGICVYALWLSVINLSNFVNFIVWRDNTRIVAPFWCDIVTKVQVGVPLGIRACTLVLCFRLFNVTRMRGSFPTNSRSERRKALAIDLLLTLGLPLVTIAVYVAVQPSRFVIIEELGCYSAASSVASFAVEFTLPVLFSLVSAVLAALTARVFLRHRKEMNALSLSSTDSTEFYLGKYSRIIVITCLDTVINAPILLFCTIQRIIPDNGSHHSGRHDLKTIVQIPASVWGADRRAVLDVKWTEWVYVAHALVFFAVFGTTPEMVRGYRRALSFVAIKVGLAKELNVPMNEGEGLAQMTFASNPNAGNTSGIIGHSR